MFNFAKYSGLSEDRKAELLEQDAYLDGYIDALTLYAWWKDGTQYVGCGMQTLEDAIKEAKNKYGNLNE